MAEYIKQYFEKRREVEALQYTKDLPLEEIKLFLQKYFVKCEFGELVVKINEENKALLYGDYIVKDVFGNISVFSEYVFNKLYILKYNQ